MCDSNGDSAKVTNEGRSMDEGFCHLMGAMYNDMPSELDAQTKRNTEMTRSIRSIRLPRPTTFAARYVTKVLHPSPMIVSKRLVKPQMLGDNNGQGSDQDRLLRKLFCVPLLSKIVLLITPRGSNSHMNDMFNIHAYMIEDQFHLGVTSLTASERELFVNPQKPNNYALICCSGYIHLEDAFMNASLKKNIIRLSKNKSDAVVEIECKGKRLSLQYTGDPHQTKIEATGSGKSRQVKIPARNATAEIYPQQLKNISTNRQINAATSEVPPDIVDNEIEKLSESNANSVEQPQPLAQIVHQNIQQNIDNVEQIMELAEQQPSTETPVYQRWISSCSPYSYRERCLSKIFSKSQPDKMLSSSGTWDVRVKQKRSSYKSLVTETRKPQWVTGGLNSKHRNYVVIHKQKK